jgi:glutathione S-transferase
MTLKLWGRASSGNVQKALWALDELGLAYGHIEAGGAHGIVNDARYRAMNPNGLVPTLEEDGFVLWESNAILRYLAYAHPRVPLVGGDAHELEKGVTHRRSEGSGLPIEPLVDERAGARRLPA